METDIAGVCEVCLLLPEFDNVLDEYSAQFIDVDIVDMCAVVQFLPTISTKKDTNTQSSYSSPTTIVYMWRQVSSS